MQSQSHDSFISFIQCLRFFFRGFVFSREEQACNDTDDQYDDYHQQAGIGADLVTVMEQVVGSIQAQFQGNEEQQGDNRFLGCTR